MDLKGARLHKVDSWVCTNGNGWTKVVYTPDIATGLFAQGCVVEYRAQYRVCVLDRPHDQRIEGNTACYMCNRGQ